MPTLLVLVLFCIPLVAADDLLKIVDVTSKLDGDFQDNLDDGDNIHKNAIPGSILQIRVEIENNFREDIDIANIRVKATIKSIDDGDDETDTARSFTLEKDESRKVTLDYKIPEDAKEGTYRILIEVTAVDQKGNPLKAERDIEMSVLTEENTLKIDFASLTSKTVECNRKSGINIGFTNMGFDGPTTLTIIGENLNFYHEETFDLEYNPHDSRDNEIRKSIPFEAPSRLTKGQYPIRVSLAFAEHKTSLDLLLQVTDCDTPKAQTPKTEITTSMAKPIIGYGARVAGPSVTGEGSGVSEVFGGGVSVGGTFVG
ncbi:MAG: COG1470 family protein, partial [Candidatus Thorarchaeota archaeon]